MGREPGGPEEVRERPPRLLACRLSALLTGCAAGREEPDSVSAPASASPSASYATVPSAAPTAMPSATPTPAPTPTVRTVSRRTPGGEVTGTSGREQVPLGEQVAVVVGGVLARSDLRSQPGLDAHSLVSIAAGDAIAQCFSLLLLDGQATWMLASNPFAQPGVELFGTYGRAVDHTRVSTRTTANVQVGAIVVAHVLGVVLAVARGRCAGGGDGRPAARRREAEQEPTEHETGDA